MALLEGLEVSEIMLSEMILDNEKFRIDSDFFLKKYLNSYSQVKSKQYYQLKDVVSVLTDFSANGSYQSIAQNFKLLSEKDSAYMVRSTDFEKNDFENDVKYIDKHAYTFLEKSIIFGGELLINKIGSPGRVYLMPNLNRPVSLGMNLFMIRLKSELNFTEKFLWIYLKTNFGKKIIQRKINGTVPLTFDKKAILSLYIPKFIDYFPEKIENLITNSENFSKKSKQTYAQAEKLLLTEIGLQDFKPSNEAVNIKNFQDSFATSGRLDAEYYLKKYDGIEVKIKEKKHTALGSILERIHTGEYSSKYYNKKDMPNLKFYIRSTNIKNGQIVKDDNYYVEEYNFKRIARKGDVITARVGSVGIFGEIREELDGSIYSDNVLNFKLPEGFIPSVYTLLFNTSYYFELIEKLARGSVQQRLNQETLKDIVVPIINYQKQQQIADLIEQSFALKKQSEHLLAVAKEAVEIAIEQNEAEAMEYIKAETES